MPDRRGSDDPLNITQRYENHARRIFESLVGYHAPYIKGFIITLNQLVTSHLQGKGTDRATVQQAFATRTPPAVDPARLRTENVKLHNLLEEKDAEIRSLKARLVEVREKADRTRGTGVGVLRGASAPQEEMPPPAPGGGFLPAPQKDGSFDASRLSSDLRQGISVYAVKADAASGTLEFRILEDPETMKKVLSHPAGYLEPVCEAENVLTPASRTVLVRRPGRLVKQGERLVLQEKMKIRYE